MFSFLGSTPLGTRFDGLNFFVVREADLSFPIGLILGDLQTATVAHFRILINLPKVDAKWILSIFGEPLHWLSLGKVGLGPKKLVLRMGLWLRPLV